MTQAKLGDRAPGRVDHPSGRGGAAAEGLQHGLAPRRRRLHRRRVGRDPQQPHHVKTPTARTRNRVGSPQRRERRTANTAFTRRCSRARRAAVSAWSKAISQSPIRPSRARHPARTVWALASPAASSNSASLSAAAPTAASTSSSRSGWVSIESWPSKHVAHAARRAESRSCLLQLRHRACRRGHVTCGQQRLAARDQQLGGLVFAIGQLVVEFLERVQGPVVEIGGAFVGESGHRLVSGTSAVLDGLGRVARPRAFEVVVSQFGQQLVVGTGLVLQRRGDALVQPHAPHGCQLGEQRLSDERVVEPVATAGLLDDDAGLARLVERVDEVLVRPPARPARGQTGCRRPRPRQGPCSSPPEAEKVCGSRLPAHPVAGCSGPNGRRFHPHDASASMRKNGLPPVTDASARASSSSS